MTSPSAGATYAGIERMATPLPLSHDHHHILLSFIADSATTVAMVACGVDRRITDHEDTFSWMCLDKKA